MAENPKTEASAEELGVLALAKDLAQLLDNAIRAGDAAGARQLQGRLLSLNIPADSPVAAQVQALMAEGSADSSEIAAIEAEGVTESAGTVFSNSRFQAKLFATMSQEMREYIRDEFKDGQSYGGMEMSRRGDGLHCERCEQLTGEELKAAMGHVHFHGMDAAEREKLGEAPQELDAKEEGRLKGSLAKLKRFKVNQVMEGEGTPEEKQAKLERIQQRFEKAEERLKEAREAQEREKDAPEHLRPAMKSHSHNRREALAAALNDGVVGEAMMGRGTEAPAISQGVEVRENAPPLATGANAGVAQGR